MIEKLVRKYFQWTGKDYLIPFLDGLTHIGRPSTTLFPIELLEQGMGIILSGLNNTLAIQSNLDWVWPYWAERQMDPEAVEFSPTGVTLMTANVSWRNWTAIGLPGSPRESMVDPVGMLTLRPFGWSVFPYLRLDGKYYLPPRLHGQVRQSLQGECLPCVVTAYDISSALDWRSESMAVLAEGEELISFRHCLQNQSSVELDLSFGLAIRPYNPLTIGHINRIKFKKRLWRVNRRPGLLLADEPALVAVSDRHHGDPIAGRSAALNLTSLISRSGIACGIAEYRLKLPAGGIWTLETAATVAKFTDHPNRKFQNIDAMALQKARELEFARWRENAGIGLQIEIPDKRLQTAFYAVKNHLHVFDDGDHFSPGTFLYHAHWFRDSAYLAMAYENLGWADKVKPKLRKYLEHQTSDGYFKSQNGEWDSNGQAIVTIVNHVKKTGDFDLLKECYQPILDGVRWIEKMRAQSKNSRSPHFGLLPAGISAEHFGPNDHYYWDNFWSLGAIKAAVWVAGKLGFPRHKNWLHSIFIEYKYHILTSMCSAFERVGKQALPCSPYRFLDSAAVGTLVAVSPLHLISQWEPWVRNTVDYLIENNVKNGMFFQRIIHTGLNPYLSAQLARALISLQDPRWMETLKAICRSASPTYTWPEAINPATGGGCMGDGDHGWSAAEFINLVRETLVSDRDTTVLVGAGIPAAWFKDSGCIRVTNASTNTGQISFCLEPQANGVRLSWSIERQPQQESLPVYFLIAEASGLQAETDYRTVKGVKQVPMAGESGSLDFHYL